MTFKVMARRCSTCIYRKDLHWDLAYLLDQVRDKWMEGFFKGYRICHHQRRGGQACCRGFWDHHKNNFQAGQIAQRLGMVEYVEPKEH